MTMQANTAAEAEKQELVKSSADLGKKIREGQQQIAAWQAQVATNDLRVSQLDAALAALGQAPKKSSKSPKAKVAKAAPQAASKPVKAAKAAPQAASKPVKAAKAAPKAAKAAKKVQTELGKTISESRKAVADGSLPPLKDRLKIVMGAGEVSIKTIVDALSAKNWAPKSKSLGTYISFMLGSHPETFERVRRGVYKVISSNGSAKAPKAKLQPTKVNGKKASAKKGEAASTEKVDTSLAELGVNDSGAAANPFV